MERFARADLSLLDRSSRKSEAEILKTSESRVDGIFDEVSPSTVELARLGSSASIENSAGGIWHGAKAETSEVLPHDQGEFGHEYPSGECTEVSKDSNKLTQILKSDRGRLKTSDFSADKGHVQITSLAEPKAEHVVEPEIQKADGRTELSEACFHNDLQGALHHLRVRPQDIDVPDNVGMTPLHIAALKGNDSIFRLLLQNNAPTEARDPYGATPLFYAIRRNNLEAVRTLLNYGADVEALDLNGRSPLMWAVLKDSPGLVSMLLDNGADPEVTNNRGGSAHDVCLMKGNGAIISDILSSHSERLQPGEIRKRIESHQITTITFDARGMSLADENVKVRKAAARSDQYSAPPQMFMHYTISEDRSGESEDVARTLLAALGARSERESFVGKESTAWQRKDQNSSALVDEADAFCPGIDEPAFKTLYSQAETQYEEADYQLCVASCTKAIEMGRTVSADFEPLACLYTMMGDAHHKMGDLSAARSCYAWSITEHRTRERLRKLRNVQKVLESNVIDSTSSRPLSSASSH